MGGYGIVGGNLPLAAGLGLASDYRGEDTVTVCMFGDGASNTGNFGETMNLAALWSLPVVFLVENNLYGMGTSIERHSAADRPLAEGRGLRDRRRAGRRHGRARGARGGRRAHPDRPRGAAGRPWSRPSPTATAATPRPTPRSTARRRRSRSGRPEDPIETFARALRRRRACSSEEEVEEIRAEAERDRHRGRRVRRRLARAAARHALRRPLRGRRAMRLVRGRRALARTRTAASARRDAPQRAKELAEAGAALRRPAGRAAPEPGPGRRPRRGVRAGGRGERRRARGGDRPVTRCGCGRRSATRWPRRCAATRPSS